MMNEATAQDWQSANQRALMAALADLKSVLRRHAALVSPTSDSGSPQTAEPVHPTEEKKAEALDLNSSISNKASTIGATTGSAGCLMCFVRSLPFRARSLIALRGYRTRFYSCPPVRCRAR